MIQTTVRQVAAVVRKALVRTGGDQILAEFTPGASVRSLKARLTPGNLLYKSPTFRTIVRDGIRFELDVSDYMQWCVYFGLAVEPRQALYSLVQPGQVVFDVGANVGEVLLNVARRLGNHGQVFGFEINPHTYKRCLHNLSLNEFKNVRLFEQGFGAEKGSFLLGSPNARNSGEDQILQDAGQIGIAVQITTMDDFVLEQGIERLDLVKIDVEGFEMNVLRGAEHTVKKLRPQFFIELDDKNLRQQQSSAKELVEWLEQRGYHILHANEIQPVKSTDCFSGQHFDIIASFEG
jgi:FkbM family methyltransferase